MTDDMTVRGLAENTKKSYLNSVAGLARHYRRSPDRISAPESSTTSSICTNSRG